MSWQHAASPAVGRAAGGAGDIGGEWPQARGGMEQTPFETQNGQILGISNTAMIHPASASGAPALR